MKLARLLTIAALTSLAAIALLAAAFESRADPRVRAKAPRTIQYSQSARTGVATPITALPDKSGNVYPIRPQAALVEALAGRLGGKSPLVVQGADLVASSSEGTRERFTIRGNPGYDVELAVVARVELTPAVRAAVQEALERVAREAVNMQRVVVDRALIEIETDAGLRSLPLRQGPPRPAGEPGAEPSPVRPG